MRGRELEEETKVCSLDQLIPDDYKHALDDHMEVQSYRERLQFVKRRLGLEKQKALAQAAASGGPVDMEVGNLGVGPSNAPGQGDDDPELQELMALISSRCRTFRGKGSGKSEGRLW